MGQIPGRADLNALDSNRFFSESKSNEEKQSTDFSLYFKSKRMIEGKIDTI